MKYYGKNPGEFIRQHIPCDVTVSMEDVSIKLHPTVATIRNKRKRMRWVKFWKRQGCETFSRSYVEITKP
jgi:hypothetical protein